MWPKKRSVLNVFLKARVRAPLLHCLLLQYRNATDMTQQEQDKERGHNTQMLGTLHHR